ncbi:NAD(+) diphosphatase [Parablautia intestinalis]|uniref:hypothetical protein n=1 Tax=Parablautia intestinalis TaxID=2320100 RepID=UPI0024125BC1|nr:hypothetical protein [Parablautia intestinalis]
MIQDISPCRLDNAYRETAPALDDCVFSFRGEEVLLREREDGCRSLPSFRDLQYPAEEMPRQAVFLFRVDKESVFLLDGTAPGCRGLRYFPVCGLKGILPGWAFFAGVTALHLNHWYGNNRYCGRCGSVMEKKMGQRALVIILKLGSH